MKKVKTKQESKRIRKEQIIDEMNIKKQLILIAKKKKKNKAW